MSKMKAGKATRKYQTELAVGLHTKDTILIPPDQLHSKAKLDPQTRKTMDRCHIYLICRRPALYFDPITFSYNQEGVSGHICRKLKGVEERSSFKLQAHPPAGGKIEVAPYPHRRLVSYSMDGMEDSHWPISVVAMRTDIADRTFVDLEVVYVGQAYGQGHRSARDRLKNHEGLQKVLADLRENKPDDEILIVMAQYEPPQIFASMDGRTKSTIGGEADTDHFISALKSPLTGREQVGLAEAGLIRYFQPEYNDKLKEKFPNLKQQVLRGCYEKDFSGLTVEINTEEFPLRLWSKRREAGYHHIASFDLHDQEKRQSFFGITDKGGDFVLIDMSGPAY